MIIEKASLLFKPNQTTIEVTGIDTDSKKVKLRLFKKGDVICYYRKNSHKYGYRLEERDFIDIVPITHRKSTSQKWQDGWEKVKSKLEASGLWKEIIGEINIALNIGYDKMKLAYDKYWEIQDEDEKIEYMKQLGKGLIGLNGNLELYVKSSLIWSYAKLPQVKKMYFGKYKTPEVLDRIQNAIQNKKEISEYGQSSYDVSFHYNPESSRANYSEEYRGCGNGHYFIALNASHALHCEDD